MLLVEDLPIEILTVLSRPEFDDEAGIIIRSVEYIEDDLIVVFYINFLGNLPDQLWQVKIEAVKGEKITRTWSDDLILYSQHPLLLEYTDTQSELYFKGVTTEWRNLFIDIFEKISQLTDDGSDLSQYIFSPQRLKEISQYGHGLFASGPITILKIYEECLTKYGIHAYYIGKYDPLEADGRFKLLKLGESFIIGKKIIFEKLPNN